MKSGLSHTQHSGQHPAAAVTAGCSEDCAVLVGLPGSGVVYFHIYDIHRSGFA